jgi:dTDP-L-rhamnose 4-epimerase
MKVLLTGGAGFIGSHTADALLREGCGVRVLDSLEEPVHPGHRVPEYLDQRIDFIRAMCGTSTRCSGYARLRCGVSLCRIPDYLPMFSRF